MCEERPLLLAEDLDHRELLELDPEGGVIRFAGQRAILLDAVAMGLLRKYLFENFGLAATRTVLTQFGFAHGWRMAEALQAEFQWTAEADWHRAGARIHALEGLFRLESPATDLFSAGVVLGGSYEAEQHVLHFGRAEVPVCWTISGLISGYMSRVTGKEVFVLEDRCTAEGHAGCRLFGRTREEWGVDREQDLHFFQRSRLDACLDVSLLRVTETLKAAERKLREHQRALVKLLPDAAPPPDGLVMKSAAMRRVVDLARRVALVDSTVLVTGETGAGKERIARLVHHESVRSSGPFIAINCGAITETLLESELFGHARGAFTGATQDRPGLFEAANGGTLLLDEIGEVSPAMQVKLLRALQEREVRRIGENKSRRVDVRVIAATNVDLSHSVSTAAFRQDLYYRLKVIELPVPPLRERRDDILPLARLLLASAAVRMKRSLTGFAPGVADQLLRHDWPGNVRELENTMERAVALARTDRVELDDLPEEVRRASSKVVVVPSNVRPLAQVEQEYILAALEANAGNQTRTAEQLQIGSATLYRKLKAYRRLAETKA